MGVGGGGVAIGAASRALGFGARGCGGASTGSGRGSTLIVGRRVLGWRSLAPTGRPLDLGWGAGSTNGSASGSSDEDAGAAVSSAIIGSACSIYRIVARIFVAAVLATCLKVSTSPPCCPQRRPQTGSVDIPSTRGHYCIAFATAIAALSRPRTACCRRSHRRSNFHAGACP